LRIRVVYRGSGIFIPDPGSWIPYPTTTLKEEGGKKLLSYSTFFSSHQIPKKENYLIFEPAKKKREPTGKEL
jgi:hypothetical protein